MGNINSTIIPASSILAQQQQPSVAKPETRADNPQVINNVVVGQAAVVHIASTTTNRAASHGVGRRVDAGFEKQGSKKLSRSEKEEKEKNSAGAKKTVDIQA